MTEPTIVHCPTCDKDVIWSPESKWKPFCSERCKLIDLGEWFTEGYKLPTQDSGQQSEEDS